MQAVRFQMRSAVLGEMVKDGRGRPTQVQSWHRLVYRMARLNGWTCSGDWYTTPEAASEAFRRVFDSVIDTEKMKEALDLALAIANANDRTNGNFETKLGANNEVISEKR